LVVINEQECKLDAQNSDQLQRLRTHIINDPHYVTLDDARFFPDIGPDTAKKLELLGIPEKFTPPRLRIYYDDLHLSAFRQSIEIRIQPQHTDPTGADSYTQVIKIGNNKSAKNGLFERMEYTTHQTTPIPDLCCIEGPQQENLQKAFGAKNLSKAKIFPLIRILSQRWQIEYHPDGDPHTRIEYAHDVAIGETCTGHTWHLYQAELELKAGNPNMLINEQKRLMQAFDFLTPGAHSKPSAGFHELTALLSQAKIREKALKSLTPGAFKVLDKTT